jgi:hypothetical protein
MNYTTLGLRLPFIFLQETKETLTTFTKRRFVTAFPATHASDMLIGMFESELFCGCEIGSLHTARYSPI